MLPSSFEFINFNCLDAIVLQNVAWAYQEIANAVVNAVILSQFVDILFASLFFLIVKSAVDFIASCLSVLMD